MAATKEQERAALKKIQKIIEELGADSYIGYAMQGMAELAEQNIEEDAAYSLQERADRAQERVEKLEAQFQEQERELKKMREELEQARKEAGEEKKQAEHRKMPSWMYEDIQKLALLEKNRCEHERMELMNMMAKALLDEGMEKQEKKELVVQHKQNEEDIMEMDRLLEVLKRKYEFDYISA